MEGQLIAEEQQAVDELVVQGTGAPVPGRGGRGDAESRHPLPQVAPAAGKHTRLHCVPRWKEGQNVQQETFRESVCTSIRSHPRSLTHLRHSVEQVVAVRSRTANKASPEVSQRES